MLVFCFLFSHINCTQNLTLKIYDFSIKSLGGIDLDISRYEGHVLLIVNVASLCGFTPQYKELQLLHLEFSAKGLSILAFPCNDFSGQEPGSEMEIRDFCNINYGISFEVHEKIKIRGESPSALFDYLENLNFPVVRPRKLKAKLFQIFTLIQFWFKEKRFPLVGEVTWNFHKFIIGKNGCVAGHFSSDCDPFDDRLIACIKRELNK